MSCSKFNNL